jgi:hypothetical protein
MVSAPPPSTGYLRRRVTALHALCVHAEGVVAGARVAVLGDARLDLGTRLMELGARAVHVFDPAPERARAAAANAPRSVAYHALTGGALDVRDGAFDAVLIPDLAALPTPDGVAREVRRVLSPSGVALVLARAHVDGDDPVARDLLPELGPASLPYAVLFDEFSLQFAEVSVSGVLPFRGVVFAELGRDDDEGVAVDGRLAEGEPTNVFLVAASGERPELAGYSLVQLPLDDSAGDAAAEHATFVQERLHAQVLASQLEEERERVTNLEARLSESRAPVAAPADPEKAALAERCAWLEQTLASREAELLRELSAREAELERELSARQAEVARVSKVAAELEATCRDFEARLRAEGAALLERDDEIATLRAHLDARNADPKPDAAWVEALEQRAHRAEAALALHVSDLEHLGESHAREIEGLEAQLRDRARVIQALQQELVRRERLVYELIATVEELRHGVPVQQAAAGGPSIDEQLLREEGARLARKLDELAADAARREGELVAQAWRITELERDLVRAREAAARGAIANGGAQAATDAAGGAAALSAALDELDALRQALAQEHAAKVAVESGDALVKARAELQRQSALLEQLRRSRDT